MNAFAQADRPIYTDNFVNNFSDGGSGITYSVTNQSPVNSGGYSIMLPSTLWRLSFIFARRF